MRIRVGRINILEEAKVIEVSVGFSDDSVDYNRRSAKVEIYLDLRDGYTVAEIKKDAVEKAKEFLLEASKS